MPDSPTYDLDVHPYFADHCLTCHGSPSANGAPTYFRLDVYDDTGTVPGAMSMSASAVADVQSARMPVGGGVGPNGKQMLVRWVDNGSPR